MIATQVIDAAVFGPIRHAPGRTLLAVLAIALGVALGLAIYLTYRFVFKRKPAASPADDVTAEPPPRD